MSSPDYYKILQVAKNASESDIRKAYVIFSELFYLYDLNIDFDGISKLSLIINITVAVAIKRL